jgi:hypothetical protein
MKVGANIIVTPNLTNIIIMVAIHHHHHHHHHHHLLLLQLKRGYDQCIIQIQISKLLRFSQLTVTEKL